MGLKPEGFIDFLALSQMHISLGIPPPLMIPIPIISRSAGYYASLGIQAAWI